MRLSYLIAFDHWIDPAIVVVTLLILALLWASKQKP